MSFWVSSAARSRIGRQLVGVALVASALLFAGSKSSALSQGGFSVGNYRPVPKAKQIGVAGEEVYRAQLTNGGASVSAVRAKVISLSVNMRTNTGE